MLIPLPSHPTIWRVRPPPKDRCTPMSVSASALLFCPSCWAISPLLFRCTCSGFFGPPALVSWYRWCIGVPVGGGETMVRSPSNFVFLQTCKENGCGAGQGTCAWFCGSRGFQWRQLKAEMEVLVRHACVFFFTVPLSHRLFRPYAPAVVGASRYRRDNWCWRC